MRTAAAAFVCLSLSATNAQANLTHISVATDGTPGNEEHLESSISGNGLVAAFSSDSNNLVTGDTNGSYDVFVRDLATNETTRISVSTGGAQGNDDSTEPQLSYDGRFVVFLSWASNLVDNDTNGEGDVFVHDRKTATTTLVSVSSDGTQSNDFSCNPAISADGRMVAFFSDGTNLVDGDNNAARDVFLHDRQTGVTTRVSVRSNGAEANDLSAAPVLSADGQVVAFHSDATTLVADDSNGVRDVFVHDVAQGTTTRVSVSSAGAQGNDESRDPDISATGRYVTFQSDASNLIDNDTNGTVDDVFVHDRETGETVIVNLAADGSQGDNNSFDPTVDADARVIGFHSWAENFATDTNDEIDAFVIDRVRETQTLVSKTTAGVQGNDTSRNLTLDEDGRRLTFDSIATNLFPNDFNTWSDVFVYDRGAAVVPRTLAAAVLPSSRSVQVGNAATAFVTIINTAPTTATACHIRTASTGLGNLTYQTTDASNVTTGAPDTPVDIAAGAAQTFLISFTPIEVFESEDVQFLFDCTNGHPAANVSGLNTLLMSASTTPVADIVALAATPTGDGIVDLPGADGANAFGVATVNVGSMGSITASVDTGDATLPLALFVCETDATGQCLADPAPSATSNIPANGTPTFSIFVNGSGNIGLDAAANRVFVRFKNAGGVTRGSTSVAVRTVN